MNTSSLTSVDAKTVRRAAPPSKSHAIVRWARHYRKKARTKLLYNVFLPTRDFCSCLINPRLFSLHRRMKQSLRDQRKSWNRSYTGNYYYQGFRRIGVNGVKPTEDRIANYGILPLLRTSDRVLDIGSNCGFMCLYLANYVGSVEGIELNPYLNNIAKDAQQFLKITNATFITDDFSRFTADRSYDVVLSLSNHHTIDGNLDMGFENYIKKIFQLMVPGGLLFFESHNVFGNNKTGAPGDDSDLDDKFDIVERYFEVVRYRMVPRFFFTDIDKLFVILRRRQEYTPSAQRTLSLAEARCKYSYD